MCDKTESPFCADLVIHRTEIRLSAEEVLKLRIAVEGLHRIHREMAKRIEALEQREHSHPLGVGSLSQRG